MQVPLLDLKAQYQVLREEIRQAMDEVCDAQQFVLGPVVQRFEEEVAAYCGARYAIGVSSGTDALLAALMALGVGRGDAVITTPFTFFATAGVIARVGARPVFVDIDPVTFNLDPAQVRRLFENPPDCLRDLCPAALMPVHLFGQCADMDALLALAGEHGCHVIEDAAQAIGAEYPASGCTKRAGVMGAMGCFSFFPSKNLGGFGDGGMVTTNDVRLAELLRSLRMHGAVETYYHRQVGGNFRLDALQAAVLRVKLKHLDRWHAARRAHAEFYNNAFRGSGVVSPAAAYPALQFGHIYNQYVIRVPHRDEVRQRLQQAGVGSAVYYPLPLHLQECFKSLGYRAGDFPVSEKAAAEVLALPVYPELRREQLEYVAQTVLEAVQ